MEDILNLPICFECTVVEIYEGEKILETTHHVYYVCVLQYLKSRTNLNFSSQQYFLDGRKNFFFCSFVRRLDDPAIRVYLTCHNILHSGPKPDKRCYLGKSHCYLCTRCILFKNNLLQHYFPLLEHCVWYLLTRCKSFRKKACILTYALIYISTPPQYFIRPLAITP